MWAIALGLTTGIAVWAGTHTASLHDELQLAYAGLEREARTQAAVARPDASDLAAHPPLRADPANALARLEASAEAAQVNLISAQLEEQAATSAAPAQLRLTASVQGSYAATKQLMQQLLSEVAGATVSAFHMSRASQPALLDTTLEIVIWSAPQADPAR